MDVSVVIPCYNRAGIVGQAIGSVLNQTLPPKEVIVVDDGSTDESADVAASFGDSVKVIRTQNRGPSAARNTGIAEARGEWVAFLDSDDFWVPDKLALQYEASKAFPTSDLIFCDTAVFEGSVTRMISRFALGGIYGLELIRRGNFLEFDRSIFVTMLTQSRVITSAVVARRKLPELRYPENLKSSEDWALWLDLSLRYRFAAVDQVLVHMFQNGDNISLRVALSTRTHLAALENLHLDPILTADEKNHVGAVMEKSRSGALYHSLVEGEMAQARSLLRAIPCGSIGVGRWASYWIASRLPSSWIRRIARWRGTGSSSRDSTLTKQRNQTLLGADL